MSEPTVRGIVHVIEETKTYGQSGFRKRLVVLEQDLGRFTNYIPFEFTHEGCDTVDELKVGDDVTFTYRLSGRKWQRDPNSEVKFFLNAEARSFQVHAAKSSASPQEAGDGSVAGETGETGGAGDTEFEDRNYSDDDVPF